MKCKLQITNLGNLTEACELADVKLLDTKKVGKTILATVSFKNPSQLFYLGQYTQNIQPEPEKEIKADKPKTEKTAVNAKK
jgi:hypothetical protein